MKPVSHNIFRTFLTCFQGLNLYLQLCGFVATYILVTTGIDWKYFLFFHNSESFKYLFPAALVGFVFPIIIPLTLIIIGKIKKNLTMLNAGYATGQAGILGLVISSIYKFFTGRPPPPEHLTTVTNTLLTNTSKIFRFGFDRGGVFNGWPSSHTAVSTALATTLLVLFPKNRVIQVLAILYALYVGIGVSVSIHWFSDFVSGAILGIVIGLAVGRSFRKRVRELELSL